MMKVLAFGLLITLLAVFPSSSVDDASELARINVIVQGDSVQNLVTYIKSSGGTINFTFEIINAVSASVTHSQILRLET